MAVKASTVLAVCKKYVGTKESPANSNNVIFNTHYYGKAVSGSAYPWCAVFLWDCFREAGASSLFYGGNKCAYTPTLANYYKNKNAFYTKPKVGDLVFYQFKGSSRINHVGIVLEVLSNGNIKTIEGNTSSTNDANGGAVEIRTRALTYVKGFGRPAYAAETAPAPSNPNTKAYTRTDFIKEVQKALGVKVDGVASTTLLNKTVTVSTSINRRHAVVKPIQRYLNAIGYNCGNVDGDAGSLFDAAVKSYQKTWTSKPDGEITKKGKTWKKMLGMA